MLNDLSEFRELTDRIAEKVVGFTDKVLKVDDDMGDHTGLAITNLKMQSRVFDQRLANLETIGNDLQKRVKNIRDDHCFNEATLSNIYRASMPRLTSYLRPWRGDILRGDRGSANYD